MALHCECYYLQIKMGKITALKLTRSNKRVNVFVDGSFSVSLGAEVVARENIKVGQDLSEEQIAKLKQSDLLQSCFDMALHYLSYRPRSEAEVRQRLRRRGFDSQVVDRVLAGLKERGLIDDVAFAQYWRDSRLSFKPRSQRAIELELRQKGVAAETASEVVEDIDDEVVAYQAGLKKARTLSRVDYGEFHRRLFGYLQRRGFSYEVIRSVVVRLWQER